MKRKIPLSVWMNIFFGGFANQFGWLFFGFGMIFFWIFAMNADTSFFLFSGERITHQGIVTDSRETNVSEDEEAVYEIHYTFIDYRGKKLQDFSYATGNWLNKGSKVTIEYPVGKPYYSRIQGMRRKMFGPLALLVILFPLIGLISLLFGSTKALRRAKLLQHGVATKGKLLSKEVTNITINDQQVYKFTFAFQDSSGKEYKVSEKTHNVDVLQDDSKEDLLYLHDNPENAVLVDSLPGPPKLDKYNNLQPNSSGSSFHLLILPLIVLSGHSTYIFFTFL